MIIQEQSSRPSELFILRHLKIPVAIHRAAATDNVCCVGLGGLSVDSCTGNVSCHSEDMHVQKALQVVCPFCSIACDAAHSEPCTVCPQHAPATKAATAARLAPGQAAAAAAAGPYPLLAAASQAAGAAAAAGPSVRARPLVDDPPGRLFGSRLGDGLNPQLAGSKPRVCALPRRIHAVH